MILQKINNQKGFTLIELVIVFIIVLILAAAVGPRLCSISINTSSEVVTQQEEKAVVEKSQVTPAKQKESMTKL